MASVLQRLRTFRKRPPVAGAAPSLPAAPTRIVSAAKSPAARPSKRGRFMGMFGSSHESLRAHQHARAMEKLGWQFQEKVGESVAREQSTARKRNSLIRANIIEPVKTRKQKAIEAARRLVRKPKETAPHLVRYRMPEKTAATFVMKSLLNKGPKRSWGKMGEGQQEAYAKVVLRFVFAENPSLRATKDPRALQASLDPIFEHLRKKIEATEAKRERLTSEQLQSELDPYRRAYSVISGVREGIQKGQFIRVKV